MSYEFIEDKWLADKLSLQFAHKLIFNGEEGELSTLKISLPEKSNFIHTSVPCHNLIALNKLIDYGFKVVDTRLTLSQDTYFTLPVSEMTTCRESIPEDKAIVSEIARTSFIFSRFHLDPLIPNEKANALKSAWAENFFNKSRGDALIVAETKNSSIAGFLLLLKGKEKWVIDIIAVDSKYRNLGVAKQLISYANKKFSLLNVGTQASNLISLRLYESLGFKIISSEYVLHYHKNMS